MYKAYITTLKNVRKHPNADKLLLGDCFGNTVCVSTEYQEGQIGIYFPTDGQVSIEYAEYNNLLRKKDDAGNNIGGYMDPNKRNVCTIKLRGEKSDGLFMPLESLAWAGDISTLKVGDTIDIWNGKEICKKYIPVRKNKTTGGGAGSRAIRKAKHSIAPTFFEHADTEQLAYNLSAFKPGDEIEITLKMHGTSQRTGYHKVFKGLKVKNPFFQGIINKYESSPNLSKFAQKCVDIATRGATPIYDWDYVSGTRRVVLESYEGGFYGDNHFREQHSKFFEGKLWKGETVYYEVVGFTDTGAPIMASCENSKVKDKEFTKQYGKTTTFSYGCSPIEGDEMIYQDSNKTIYEHKPQSDIYVYRMTMTNEDGNVVEYTPDFMRYRCEQIGVKTVPVLWKGTIPQDEWLENCYDCDGEYGNWKRCREESPGEWIKNKAEEFYDGPDPIGKTHIREGVVVRIVNRPTFRAYKHKNFYFKALEGIIKDTADAPDMEEAQEIS